MTVSHTRNIACISFLKIYPIITKSQNSYGSEWFHVQFHYFFVKCSNRILLWLHHRRRAVGVLSRVPVDIGPAEPPLVVATNSGTCPDGVVKDGGFYFRERTIRWTPVAGDSKSRSRVKYRRDTDAGINFYLENPDLW